MNMQAQNMNFIGPPYFKFFTNLKFHGTIKNSFKKNQENNKLSLQVADQKNWINNSFCPLSSSLYHFEIVKVRNTFIKKIIIGNAFDLTEIFNLKFY